MPETRRNPDGSTTEIAPTHGGNGHPLGPGQVLLAYEPHGDSRARSWTCRVCGHKTWGDPSDRRQGSARALRTLDERAEVNGHGSGS